MNTIDQAVARLAPSSVGGSPRPAVRWELVDRFLIFGTEGGTYTISEQRLTRDHAPNLLECIKQDGQKVVRAIVAIADAGRAPKSEPAIFALALCASYGDTATRQAAFEALPQVCRSAEHLFGFIAECEQLRGWGRGLRKAVARWYANMPADELTSQAIKVQHRGGWSHRDLLRLAHPKPPSEEHRALFKWLVDDELTGQNPRLAAFHELMRCEEPGRAAQIIRESKMPRECVPTNLLNEPEVWEALLEDMPLKAKIRELANLTRCGLLAPRSEATRAIVADLMDANRLVEAGIHPIALLLAHATYASGHGLRGQHAWMPVPEIVEALDESFYLAYRAVRPTGKRYAIGIDVSGSMSQWTVAGTPLSACEAAAAWTLVTMATEEAATPLAFADDMRELPLSSEMRLNDALLHTHDQNFGGTDCAQPMLYAAAKGLEVDVFVVLTDNETWVGNTDASQALWQYRQDTGVEAKLAVVGMCSNGFAIADPKDAGMLDVVGFDASVPQVLREFAVG